MGWWPFHLVHLSSSHLECLQGAITCSSANNTAESLRTNTHFFRVASACGINSQPQQSQHHPWTRSGISWATRHSVARSCQFFTCTCFTEESFVYTPFYEHLYSRVPACSPTFAPHTVRQYSPREECTSPGRRRRCDLFQGGALNPRKNIGSRFFCRFTFLIINHEYFLSFRAIRFLITSKSWF